MSRRDNKGVVNLNAKPKSWKVEEGIVFGDFREVKGNWKTWVLASVFVISLVGCFYVANPALTWISLGVAAVSLISAMMVTEPSKTTIRNSSTVAMRMREGKFSLLLDKIAYKLTEAEDAEDFVWQDHILNLLFNTWDKSETIGGQLETDIKRSLLELAIPPQSESAITTYAERIRKLNATVERAFENRQKLLEIEEVETTSNFISDVDSLIQRVDMEDKVFSEVTSELSEKYSKNGELSL